MDKSLVHEILSLRESKDYRFGEKILFLPRILKAFLKTGKISGCKVIHMKEIKKNLNFQDLFPIYTETVDESRMNLDPYQETSNKKIKVTILFTDYSFQWHSYETLVRAFADDNRFDVVLVTKHAESNAIKWVLGEKPNVHNQLLEHFDPEREKPDIAVLAYLFKTIGFYEKQFLYDIKAYSKLVIGVPLTLAAFWPGTSEHQLTYGTDYVLLNEMLYQEAINAGYNAEHYVSIQNPKIDVIYAKLGKQEKSKFRQGNWENKKIVLWAVDHSIGTDEFSFDQYLQCMLDYFSVHKEWALIIRTHSDFMANLMGAGVWTDAEIDFFVNYVNASENMIYDEEHDYREAYAAADIVVTDVGCGIRFTALAIKKPIVIIHRMGVEQLHLEPSAFDCFYHIKNCREMVHFFDNFDDEKDELQDKRTEVYEKIIAPFDGNNGRRMKEWIAEKYFETLDVDKSSLVEYSIK